MTDSGQSDSAPIVELRRAITIDLTFEGAESGGSDDGINVIPDGGDGYTITPVQARAIAQAFTTAAAEAEARR